MGEVERHQPFQPSGGVAIDGTAACCPAPDGGLMPSGPAGQLTLRPAKHGKADQQPMRRHGVHQRHVGGLFIMNTGGVPDREG